MRKKMLSLLLAGIFMSQAFTGIAPVKAAEMEEQAEQALESEQAKTEETVEIEEAQESNQNIIKTENLAEFQKAVLEQQKKWEVLTEEENNTGVSNAAGSVMFGTEQETVVEPELAFDTRTLIVSAEEAFDVKEACVVVRDSDNLSVLIYETEEETKEAYEYFKELEGKGIESVTVDTITQIADTNEVAAESEEFVKSQLQMYIEENRTETEVKVAIIDTGLDKTTVEYERIQNRILDTGLNLSTSGEIENIQDDNGHGTDMISVIAGMTMENIKLLPIKAANAYGQSTVLRTYLALQSAMELRADVILIGMYGKSGSVPLLRAAIEQATAQGILVVGTDGNDHMEIIESTPEKQGEEASKIPEDWIEIKDAAWFSGRSSWEINALSTSAVTANKGHHVEYHPYEHENKLIGYSSGYASQCDSNCEYGATEGTLAYERWEYGFTCIEDEGDWTAWTFTIYTHSGTNFVHKWSEIWIRSGGGWLVAEGDAAVNDAEADRESYLQGGGAKYSCPGYLVANTYNMVYDSNGGSGSIGNGTAKYNTTYTISADQFYRTGYTFNGYYIKRKSDGKIWGGSTNGWLVEKSTNESKYKKYQRGKEVIIGNSLVSEDVSLTTDTFTFVATWEKNTYTIEYNPNGATSGSMNSTSVKYGEKFTIAENKFAKTGHTFQGYYVKRGSDSKWYCGSTNKWQSSADITANSYTKTLFKDDGKERTMSTTWVRSEQGTDTFTFYAVWKANSYTVTYNANGNVKGTLKGSEDSITTVEVTYGKTISLSKKAVSKDSYYTFVGWSKSKSGEPLSSLKMGTKDVTLYAVYSPPVSDIKEVYLLLADKTGKLSKNGKEAERCCSLTKTGNVSSPVKGYNYELEKINYKKSFQKLFPNSAIQNIVKSLVVVDHAGNSTQIPLDDVMIKLPESFQQTVKHLFQNLDTNEYEDIGDYIVNQGVGNEEVRKTTIEELVESGQSYTPEVLAEPLPEGYQFNNINSTEFNRKNSTNTDIGKKYKVTETKTTYACYDAIPYTLTFDPNGGNISDGGISSKNVYTGKVYDYLPGNAHTGFPNVTRKGYTLKGWYKSKTDATDGTRVYPTTIYTLSTNSTIYAQWEVNSYKVTYDYWTNGGTAAWKAAGQMDYTTMVKYGKTVALNVTAEKEGWTHVGWSLSPNSTTVLTTAPKMGAEDLTLYAVYKKNITATYIDRNDTGIQTRSETKTIYNREEGINVILPEQNVWTEQKTKTKWENEGWCPVENGVGELPDAETPATVVAKTSMFLKNDTAFYGRYSKNVTVSYDTNGSLEEIPEETKTRYYNASGMYQNPLFTLADAPTLLQNSFVCWVALDTVGVGAELTTEYAAGQDAEFTEDTLLTAKWDKYPELEAYDRYFTLEQAKNGEITPMVLLEKVKGTDKEDGDLKNGTDVVVINYRSEDFSGFILDGSVPVTYQATDSFGNAVTKTVMVYIRDLTPQEIQIKKYVRFISTRFYKDKNSYVAAEQGGLENASVWKQNPAYRAVLERALNNKKINETVIDSDFLEQEQDVVKPGSGTWEHEAQTWVFSQEEVQAVKEFIDKNGLGDYQEPDGIEKFFRQFSGSRE